MFGWLQKKSPETLTQIAWEKAHDAIFSAGKKGDLAKVAEITARYPDALEWKDHAGLPALHMLMTRAINKDNLVLITEILTKYPQAKEVTDSKGSTPLHIALTKGRMKSFTHLIEEGCNMNAQAEYVYLSFINATDYMNVFTAACFLNKKDFALCLIRRGASMEITNYKVKENVAKNQKLKYYIERAPQIRAEYLAAQKMDDKAEKQRKAETKIETKEKVLSFARETFFKAIHKGDLAAIAATVAAYPQALEWKTLTGKPALFFAMEANRIDSFRSLVNLGADMNVRLNDSPNPPCPIHLAAKDGRENFVRFMVQQGAKTDAVCGWHVGDGDFEYNFVGNVATAYDIAVQKNHLAIAGLLQNAHTIRADYLATAEGQASLSGKAEPSLQDKFKQMAQKLEKTEAALGKTNALLDEALKRIEALESPAPPVLLKQEMPRQNP